MIELNKSELSSLKKVEIAILNEVARICEMHNLRYSLTGGTLLGAVRHKGFIPWDDDIDIVMPYNDYLLFLEYAENEMSDSFYITNIYKDKNYGYLPMSKVMANNTTIIEEPAKNVNTKNGIFVDIFPLYNTSNNSLIRKLDFYIIQRLSKSLRCKNGYHYKESKIHSFIYNLRHILLKIIPTSFYIKLFEFIVNKNTKTSKYIVSYGGIYGIEKETFPKEWFDNYSYLEFEKNKYMCMDMWDIYLKSHYGNYMELPPKDKRVPHHFLEKYENNFNIKK